MVRLALIALALAPSLTAGCVAGALPPSRTDVGELAIAGGGRLASGLRVATGAHWASGAMSRDTSLDVGGGYVYQRIAADDLGPPDLAAGAATSVRGPVDGEMRPARYVEWHGGYLEVAHTIERSGAHRSWLGARGELLLQAPDARRATVGGYARAAWELFSPREGAGVFAEGCGGGAGVAHGTLGLGVYVESGAQWSEDQGTAFVATAGLSLRLPFVAGFAFDLCPHC
jgi:hypothetical protein